MQQYVEEVLDFTSQYGCGGSISYTAHNLVGKPQIFPSYGDFPQAYVMVSMRQYVGHTVYITGYHNTNT
jgi:hypothetical protein